MTYLQFIGMCLSFLYLNVMYLSGKYTYTNWMKQEYGLFVFCGIIFVMMISFPLAVMF